MAFSENAPFRRQPVTEQEAVRFFRAMIAREDPNLKTFAQVMRDCCASHRAAERRAKARAEHELDADLPLFEASLLVAATAPGELRALMESPDRNGAAACGVAVVHYVEEHSNAWVATTPYRARAEAWLDWTREHLRHRRHVFYGPVTEHKPDAEV